MASNAEVLRVTLVIKRRTPCAGPPGAPGAAAAVMSREQFAARHAAAAADLARVAAFAERLGLRVVDSSRVARTVVVEGEKAAVVRAFAPEAGRAPGTPPAELEGLVAAVIGLAPHAPARPHLPVPAAPAASAPRFTCPEIAELYEFPAADGAGRTIAVVCLGGGFHQSDLDAFAAAIGLPPPAVTVVGVEGGANDPAPIDELASLARYLNTQEGPPPADAALFTLETTMDVELAIGFAPGARVAAYFAPSNDEQGFYQALAAAVFDTANRPSVVSLSWGWPEADWQDASAAILPVVEELLVEAAALGITFCASSGDSGAGGVGRAVWVQYPASSPYALSCGGTSIEVAGGEIVGETAWRQRVSDQVYSSGGGVSTLFARPAFQDGIALLERNGRRGLPDVSGIADRGTGIAITIGGKVVAGGGTSAVAPLWAALAARLDQALGCPLGHANPCLYAARRRDPGCFRDITTGGNPVYQASTGWDAVTGLGSPHGERLLAAIRGDAGPTGGRGLW